MRPTLLLLSFLFLVLNIVSGQDNSAHHWYFGLNAGVDFSTGVPTAVTNGQLYTDEGVATVDDSDGNLQFYTDGQEIYNANHQLMPNGTGLLGHSSATQSSIIIPFPESDSLYYVFTVDGAENHLQNGLRYSIVDMSLDSGMGDVIETEKNILLENPVSEKLTAVLNSNEEDVWLIAHKWNSNEFVVYGITAAGIDSIPIVSALGSIHQGGFSTGSWVNGWTNSAGYMKVSMDGERLALAIYRADVVEVFDFNKITGVISNCISSGPVFPNVYGVEFSPNQSKLYITQPDEGLLRQIDLSLPNPFLNSVVIAEITQASALQLAPNGKIYLSKKLSEFLGAIEIPNNSGISCNYIHESIYLEGKVCKRGLPCIFINEHFQFFTASYAEISICSGDSIFLEGTYQNIDGYYVDIYNSSAGIDSFVYTTLTVLPPPSVPIINENGGVLWSTLASGYQWYFNNDSIVGATDQFIEPDTTGIFTVEITNENGCSNTSEDFYFEFISIYEILNEFIIFPSVTNDFVNISNLSTKEDYVISLYGLDGKLLFKDVSSRNPTYKLNVGYLPPSIYIVNVSNDFESITRKIVKK